MFDFTGEPWANAELTTLLRGAGQRWSEPGHEAGDPFPQLRRYLRCAWESYRRLGARLRRAAIRRAKQADQLIRANPCYALVLAATAGIFVGILLTPDYRRSP